MARISEANVEFLNLQNRPDDSSYIPLAGFSHLYIKNSALYIRLDDNSIIPVGGGGSATSLSDLNDVTLTTPANGQILRYNGTVWVNDSLELNDLDGVNVTTTSKGAVLVYDGTNLSSIGVGSNGEVLTADSSTTTGIDWKPSSGGSESQDAMIFAILGW